MWNSVDFCTSMGLLKGFLTSCKTFWLKIIKIWTFSVFNVYFGGQKWIQSLWEWFSYLNFYLGEQLSSITFWIWINLKETYFIKLCPTFEGLTSKSLTRWQKILSGHSLRCNLLLIFTCTIAKFHDRLHTINNVWRFMLFGHQKISGSK